MKEYNRQMEERYSKFTKKHQHVTNHLREKRNHLDIILDQYINIVKLQEIFIGKNSDPTTKVKKSQRKSHRNLINQVNDI